MNSELSRSMAVCILAEAILVQALAVMLAFTSPTTAGFIVMVLYLVVLHFGITAALYQCFEDNFEARRGRGYPLSARISDGFGISILLSVLGGVLPFYLAANAFGLNPASGWPVLISVLGGATINVIVADSRFCQRRTAEKQR